MRVDVTILGAGAAGLCCAAACAERGRQVLVLDHGPKAARKVLASGGGRCNVTNVLAEAADYRCANPHFVKSALAQYGPADVISWLHAGGVATVEEAGGKLFCRDGAASVARLLTETAMRAGARLHLGVTVRAARTEPDGFVVDTDDGPVRSRSLVLALGGRSWPGLGASNLGYSVARSFGLGVTPLRPGLTPLLAGPERLALCRELSGVSLPVRIDGPCSVQGDMLFTHKGLSGPAVLDTSLFWREGMALSIDFLPGGDLEAALARTPRLDIKNALARQLPKRLAAALCHTLALTGPVAGLSKKALRSVAESVHGLPFEPVRAEGYAKAEVTLGGVDTAGVTSKTLEARQVPGLYVIGELLDVTGRLGGFNLQWAWSSGRVAGRFA